MVQLVIIVTFAVIGVWIAHRVGREIGTTKLRPVAAELRARLFPYAPADLRTLQRRTLSRMTAEVTVGVSGASIAPTTFTVFLAPDDYATVSGAQRFFVGGLTQAYEEQARKRSWGLGARLRVTVQRDDDTTPGNPRVTSVFEEGTIMEYEAAVTLTAPHARLVDDASRAWKLGESTPNVIGRGPGLAVVIDDKAVSRRHAEIVHRATTWRITDLGSTNGTRVNGAKLRSEHVLSHGDIVELGEHRLTFHGEC